MEPGNLGTAWPKIKKKQNREIQQRTEKKKKNQLQPGVFRTSLSDFATVLGVAPSNPHAHLH